MKKTGLIKGSKVFLTYEYLKDFVSSRTLESWKRYPHPEDSRKKIFSYDELKDKYKVVLPSLSELKSLIKAEEVAVVQVDQALNVASLPEKWAAYYQGQDEHFFKSKINIDGKRAKDLAMCMAILRFLEVNANKGDIKAHTGLNSREELLHAIGEHLKENGYYGLPSSYDRLRKKYGEYAKAVVAKEDPRGVLINQKFGNSNTLKRTEEHEAIILEYYLRPQKLDMLETWMNYQQVCLKELNVQPISYSSLKQYITTPYIQTLAAKVRHGNSYYETHVRPFVLRKAPEYSFSLIAGDGWEPGRSVKHMFKGQQRTGTMVVWVWYDWKSTAILSYKIAPSETSELIRQSFRDILGLHGGRCPMSVMIDKKWSANKETVSMFEKAGVFIQDKRAYNPKANIAERTNKEINRKHRVVDEFWASITNHTTNYVHNSEHVREGKPMEESEFRAMILDIVNIYNNTPQKKLSGKTPLEVLAENINPSAKVLEPLYTTWIFGDKKIVTVKSGWFTIQIASKKYEYALPDWKGFLKQGIKYNKVKVYYDERFMETVDIYSYTDEESDENDRYLYTCQPVERMNVAQVEQTEEDKKILGRHIKRGKELDESLAEEVERMTETMKVLSLDLASVHAVDQDRYKAAKSTIIAQQYKNFFEDQEREEGRKVAVTVGADSKMDTKSKYKKTKKFFDDFNQ